MYTARPSDGSLPPRVAQASAPARRRVSCPSSDLVHRVQRESIQPTRSCPRAPVPPLEEVAADAPHELHVALHDRDALGVEGAEVRVFEEMHEVAVGRQLVRGGSCGAAGANGM